MTMKNKTLKKLALASVISLSTMATSSLTWAANTIKVGVLHSLSGTMAISETTLKDTMLMLIEEQNKKGGVLGKKLEAVVVDPASNWPLFAEKARELISKNKTDVIFGCWTSVSRKSVLPVFKDLYKSVKAGKETKRVLNSCSKANYKEQLDGELAKMGNSEMWEAGKAARKLRPKEKAKKTSKATKGIAGRKAN